MRLSRIVFVVFFLFLIVVLLFVLFYPRNPLNVVGTSDDFATISANHQRKAFFANGYHWVFFCNGSDILYSTSSDGLRWSAPLVVREGISSSGLSVWYDGNVHYVYASGVPNTPVLYRRGFLSGSTIEWDSEQTVVSGVEGHEYYNGYCIMGSDGYPWAAYIENDGFYWGYCVVKASSVNGSLWGATRLFEPTVGVPRVCILPLSNGALYAVHATVDGVWGRLFNGTVWGVLEDIVDTGLVQDYGYSAVSYDDDVCLVLLEKDTNNILYLKRTFATGWSAHVVIEANQTSISFPVLSVDKLTGNLYCFWVHENILRLKKCVNGTWESVSSSPFGTAFFSLEAVTCFYQAWDRKIGVAWLEHLKVDVYRVRYGFVVP